MRETWYVLEDGSVANPAECVCDREGVLRSKDGVAVAMRGDAYSSRSVDISQHQARPENVVEMRPESPKRGYKTRATKVSAPVSDEQTIV